MDFVRERPGLLTALPLQVTETYLDPQSLTHRNLQVPWQKSGIGSHTYCEKCILTIERESLTRQVLRVP